MTEPWGGYPPEVNSGRWELGTGPETWVAASAVWTSFAEIVATATASLMGEIATMTGATLTGMTSVSMLASSVPFFGWLAHMESTALMHSLACATVAQAWGQCTAGIIPLPVVNQNRITEAALQATNIFGQNSPAIAEMDREYAQFWTQDGASMMDYDAAVSLATVPKMVMPPPPLANLAGGADQLADSAAQVATQAGQSASSMGSEMGDLSDAGSQAGGQMGQMSSMMEAPMQAVSSMGQMANPQSLMQPAQSLMQPLQSMLGQFMSGPQMGGGLGDAFQGAGVGSTGGVPLSSMGGGAGMGGGMGAGGAAMGNLSSASEKVIKPVTNLSGVPPMGSGGKLGATQAGMSGGGMGGMGGMSGVGRGETTRKTEGIVAAHQEAPHFDAAEAREERKLFT